MEKIKGQKFKDVKIGNITVIKMTNDKINDWFSLYGGVVPGTNVFVTGTSGAGKTTSMVNFMNWLPQLVSCMYSVEMDTQDVKFQTQNIEFSHENAYIFDQDDCSTIDEFLAEAEKLGALMLVLDSLQAIAKKSYPNLSEDKGCELVQDKVREWTKRTRGVAFVIGHNTKDDEFAGKNTLMQMFDAHIDFVHHKSTDERTMSWGQKNRKGKLGKLYYEFGPSNIIFHTPAEWSIVRKGKRNFEETINEAMGAYLETIDITDPKYKAFKAEFIKRSKDLEKKYNDNTVLMIQNVALLAEMTYNYKL